MKDVVLLGRGVPLLLNERDEWELPGGRLEVGEPEACVAREIADELGLSVRAEHLLDCVYEVLPSKLLFTLTYGCILIGGTTDDVRVSSEHRDARLFEIHEMDALRISGGYWRSAKAWYSRTAIRRHAAPEADER